MEKLRKKEASALPIIMNASIVGSIMKFYADKEINDTRVTIALYTHLYYTARLQNNVQVLAKDTYLMRGLSIGQGVLKRVKSDLKKIGLIEYVQKHTKGRLDDVYIKVKYVWGNNAMEKLVGDTDIRLVTMAKRYIVDKYSAYDSLCDIEDIFLPEIILNGQVIEAKEGYLYLDENEYICMSNEYMPEYRFSAEDSQDMYIQVYGFITQ